MNTDKIFAEVIANEYAPKKASKVIALKKLDRKAKSAANIFAFTFGVLMTLVLGIGMCFSMGVIGDGSNTVFILGIILGVIGIIGVSINYSLYKKIMAKSKEKYSFDIIQLAKEIADDIQ